MHGCFWHSHHCRRACKLVSNRDYWIPELAENRKRDARAVAGWRARLALDGGVGMPIAGDGPGAEESGEVSRGLSRIIRFRSEPEQRWRDSEPRRRLRGGQPSAQAASRTAPAERLSAGTRAPC